MPNWCSNSIDIIGDKESIEDFKKFLDENNGKDWFDYFLPCPQELKDVGSVSFHEKQNEQLVEKYGHSDWYSWSVENWGCKWNCDAQDWTVKDYDDGSSTISFWFDSPWGPPIALYHVIDETFDVDAHYLEEGMGFVGRFSDGFDDYYEYSSSEDLENIPQDLVEKWDLADRLLEWEEEQEDDDE